MNSFVSLLLRNGWGLMTRLDLAVADALHDNVGATGWLVDTLRALATILHPWVFRAVVLVLVVLLVRRGAWRLAWWAAITMTTGSVLGLVMKLIVARSRPSFDLPLATAPGYSFPSGHALNSAVGVLVLLLVMLPALPTVRWKVAAWCAGLVVIGLTGFDRIGLSVL